MDSGPSPAQCLSAMRTIQFWMTHIPHQRFAFVCPLVSPFLMRERSPQSLSETAPPETFPDSAAEEDVHRLPDVHLHHHHVPHTKLPSSHRLPLTRVCLWAHVRVGVRRCELFGCGWSCACWSLGSLNCVCMSHCTCTQCVGCGCVRSPWRGAECTGGLTICALCM